MTENRFSVTLMPYRSLGSRGFLIVMLLICSISFAAGLFFFLMGAWPVVGFFGLDIVLIYAAFKWNYHSGKQREFIEVTDKELVITHVSAWGRSRNWRFNRYWVRIEHAVLRDEKYQNPPLFVTSHGQKIEIARFLPPEEKVEFGKVLRDALLPV